MSIALIPLRAGADGRPAFGMLVLASPDPQRFQAGMATDFLERIAELASGRALAAASLSRPRSLRRPVAGPGWRAVRRAAGSGVLAYAAIAAVVWQHADELLDNPPQRPADAALILGNRAYLDGKPNPCLTGRVDTGIALVLQAAGVRSVVVVSEPYHQWRIERLVRKSGFDKTFDVQYAAAPTSCWRTWGMLFKGALREPAAIVNNAAYGYLF
jgi:hypothetical protein